jgi:hypothetical protein
VGEIKHERERKMTESIRRPKSTTKQAPKKGDLGKTLKGFTDEKRVPMKERIQEQKAAARRGMSKTGRGRPRIAVSWRFMPRA